MFRPVKSRGIRGHRIRNMVQQTDAEFATGTVDEYVRYFNYLKTLADLTAMASILAVQVMEHFWGVLGGLMIPDDSGYLG